MTDYVKNLTATDKVFRPEADRLVAKLGTDATVKDGVIRWNSNDRVPPEDIVALAIHIGLPIDLAKTNAARDADLDKFLAEYRANYKGPTDEERYEARAAHGPGVTLVNVITGHKWTT
jgi:hypothetical protein